MTLFIVILHFFCLFIGIFDSLVENTLQLSNLTLINHAFSSLIFDNISELLDLVIILLSGFAVFFNVSRLLFQDILQFSDCSFVS